MLISVNFGSPSPQIWADFRTRDGRFSPILAIFWAPSRPIFVHFWTPHSAHFGGHGGAKTVDFGQLGGGQRARPPREGGPTGGGVGVSVSVADLVWVGLGVRGGACARALGVTLNTSLTRAMHPMPPLPTLTGGPSCQTTEVCECLWPLHAPSRRPPCRIRGPKHAEEWRGCSE